MAAGKRSGVGGKANVRASSPGLKRAQRQTKKFYGSKRANTGPAGIPGKLSPPKKKK